jgi:hypothetical protein
LAPFRMVVPASTLTLFGPHASSNVRFARRVQLVSATH